MVSVYPVPTHCWKEPETLRLTLVEKNTPPPHKGAIVFKGYKDITVTDFPLRGRRTEFTFRRRYWTETKTKRFLTNDIPLVAPGTKLEKEFADFLKEKGRDNPYITHVYRDSLQY
jgi:hypothetical protein